MTTEAPVDFDFEQELALFLDTCRTASLATVSPQQQPHAANIQYVRGESFHLYWVSAPEALHSQHLHQRPTVALTVYARDDQVDHLHGVQMHGTAERVEPSSDEWNQAWDLYTQKFCFVAALPQFRELVQKQSFYRFTPGWARWIDNRRGFGFKVERDWREGQ